MAFFVPTKWIRATLSLLPYGTVPAEYADKTKTDFFWSVYQKRLQDLGRDAEKHLQAIYDGYVTKDYHAWDNHKIAKAASACLNGIPADHPAILELADQLHKYGYYSLGRAKRKLARLSSARRNTLVRKSFLVFTHNEDGSLHDLKGNPVYSLHKHALTTDFKSQNARKKRDLLATILSELERAMNKVKRLSGSLSWGKTSQMSAPRGQDQLASVGMINAVLALSNQTREPFVPISIWGGPSELPTVDSDHTIYIKPLAS